MAGGASTLEAAGLEDSLYVTHLGQCRASCRRELRRSCSTARQACKGLACTHRPRIVRTGRSSRCGRRSRRHVRSRARHSARCCLAATVRARAAPGRAALGRRDAFDTFLAIEVAGATRALAVRFAVHDALAKVTTLRAMRTMSYGSSSVAPMRRSSRGVTPSRPRYPLTRREHLLRGLSSS